MNAGKLIPDIGPGQTARPNGSLWALVPMKKIDRSKQRLHPRLGHRRRELSLAMFKDVSGSLVASRAFAGVAVVTSDPRISVLAAAQGIMVIDEIGHGMNAAVSQGVQALLAMGARGIAIIPADVPLITPEEIRRVLYALDRGRAGTGTGVMGILPSASRDGTNFLSIEGPMRFPFAYGPGSFKRHLAAAGRAGLEVVPLDSAAFALDIDTESDLLALVARCRANPAGRPAETWKFLCREGYAAGMPEDLRVMNE